MGDKTAVLFFRLAERKADRHDGQKSPTEMAIHIERDYCTSKADCQCGVYVSPNQPWVSPTCHSGPKSTCREAGRKGAHPPRAASAVLRLLRGNSSLLGAANPRITEAHSPPPDNRAACLPTPARSPAGRDRGLCHAAARSIPRHIPLFGVNYFSAGKRSRIIGRGSGC